MTVTKQNSSRCSVCQIKVGINYFECKCDSSKKFCHQHRFGFEHNCPINKQDEYSKSLRLQNPEIQAQKLQKV